MKKYLPILLLASLLFLTILNASAQAPSISYSPSTNVFTKNTSIGTLSPNTGGGGAVPATVYGTVTTFVPASSPINNPRGLVSDGSGNIYEADIAGNAIYKIDPSGTATLIAGNGIAAEIDNAVGTLASFNQPWGIAYSPAGFIYVSDFSGAKIRKISTTAPYAVTTLAGSGINQEVNGTGTGASFQYPTGMVFDGSTFLYVCDHGGNTIRQVNVNTGFVTIIAGSGGAGLAGAEVDNANSALARFNGPIGIAYDGSAFLYVADGTGNTIRKVSTSGLHPVTTIVSSGLSSPESITMAGGNLYVADLGNSVIKKITTSGVVSIIAGDGTTNEKDGVGTLAEFNAPYAITNDNSGNLFTGDNKSANSTIRQIVITGYTISPALSNGIGFNVTTGVISGIPLATFSPTVYTITGYNASGSSTTTVTLSCQVGNAPNINYSPSIYSLAINTAITPIVPTNSGGAVPTTIYGTVSTFVPASSPINNPRGLTVDGLGNIYETDLSGNAIYKINSSGTATLIAGNGSASESDNTVGTSASFNQPWGVAYNPAGYLYVADFSGTTIRKISTTAPYAVTTLAGYPGNPVETDGTGGNAAFKNPAGIVFDGANYLYVCDYAGNTIRKVNVNTGATVTIAGTAGSAGEVDNGTGTAAKFNGPAGIAYDGSKYLYVADALGKTIRKINTTSPYAVTTFVASTGGLSNPTGLAIDQSGYLEVADAGNSLIRTVAPNGVVFTLAGDGTANEKDAIGGKAEFSGCYSITYDYAGNLYVGDNISTNSTIRKIVLTGYTIVPVLHLNLTFDTNTGTIAGTPINYFASTQYTISAFNNWGSSSAVVTLSCGNANDWLGTTSSVWGVASNWSRGTVPISTDDVQIGVVSFTNQPTIDATTGNVNVNSITFGSAKAPTLTVNSPETLTVKGFTTVNTGSTVGITGTGIVNLAPASTLNVNGTGTLALTMSSGGQFTLKSDPTGDASVGQIAANAITGNVTVERYMTGGSGYRGNRLLSCPVYNATDGNGNHIYSINYLQSSMYLTATTTNGGFDNPTAANPTLYIFRENMIPDNSTFTGGNFRGINNILSAPNYILDVDGGPYNILASDGFLCFFRGNRASASYSTETTTGYIPQPVALSATGSLNEGQIIFRNWFTPTSSALSYTASSPTGVRGYQLVGNPYASAIDWDTFQTTTSTQGMYGVNVSNTIYELDDVTKTYGSYVAGSGGVGSASFVSNVISSGQAFFIVATTTGGQFIINESAKTTKLNTGIKLLESTKPMALSNNQFIRLKLMGKDSTVGDQTMIRFNNMATGKYTHGVDAAYMPGFGEASLSSRSTDMVDLSINNVPFPKQNTQAIKLNFNAANSGKYTLSVRDLVQVPELYDIWLKDAYKSDSVNLRLSAYSFDVNKTNSATFGAGRFTLVIRQNSELAYQLVNFAANKATTARQVEVTWSTVNEGNYTNFTVERSTDNGKTYQILGGVKATGAGNYSFADKNPVNGTSLYRLQQEDINNTISYSKIVAIQYSGLSNQLTGGKINVYPNPANSTINLAINESTTNSSVYRIKVVSSSGLVVKDITSSQSTWQGSVSDLRPGTYLIRVINNNTQDLVGENKFVKL